MIRSSILRSIRLVVTSIQSTAGKTRFTVSAIDRRCSCLSCYSGAAHGLQSVCCCNMFDSHALFVNFIGRCCAQPWGSEIKVFSCLTLLSKCERVTSERSSSFYFGRRPRITALLTLIACGLFECPMLHKTLQMSVSNRCILLLFSRSAIEVHQNLRLLGLSIQGSRIMSLMACIGTQPSRKSPLRRPYRDRIAHVCDDFAEIAVVETLIACCINAKDHGALEDTRTPVVLNDTRVVQLASVTFLLTSFRIFGLLTPWQRC